MLYVKAHVGCKTAAWSGFWRYVRWYYLCYECKFSKFCTRKTLQQVKTDEEFLPPSHMKQGSSYYASHFTDSPVTFHLKPQNTFILSLHLLCCLYCCCSSHNISQLCIYLLKSSSQSTAFLNAVFPGCPSILHILLPMVFLILLFPLKIPWPPQQHTWISATGHKP